ncbi:hypothetical protein Hanom_Chr09g00804171 [Helianthus anomalus]
MVIFRQDLVVFHWKMNMMLGKPHPFLHRHDLILFGDVIVVVQMCSDDVMVVVWVWLGKKRFREKGCVC